MINRIAILALLTLSSCTILHGSESEPLVSDQPAQIAPAKDEPVTLSFSKPEVVTPIKPTKRTSLPKPDLAVTPEVKAEIAKLLGNNRGFIPKSLIQREEHYDKIREVFADNGIPEELINVAMIESSFQPNAGSSKGAVGMWQFMKSTAKLYGLNVCAKKDERRDPLLSSKAAALHLKDLYNVFGDWFLALAAYNAGPGAISRLVNKHGKADFWELVRSGKLTQETARFVPKFIAVSLILNDLNHYGFTEVAHLQDRAVNIG